jgi:hypothetical protein
MLIITGRRVGAATADAVAPEGNATLNEIGAALKRSADLDHLRP